MGYVSAHGGEEAIRNSKRLLAYQRVRHDERPVTVDEIRHQLGFLVDRVMSEGGLYSPFHAALAVKQAQGDLPEAVLLVRAYRSTLRRLPDTHEIDTERMILSRRISSAFQDIPGGQVLGATPDYSQRILDFGLAEETPETFERERESIEAELSGAEPLDPERFGKVVEMLRRDGLVAPAERTVAEPTVDVTRDTVALPLHRSGRLQMMARADSGGLLALGYSALRRGKGNHATIAELRVGRVAVVIDHPFRPAESVTVGTMEITEAEIVASPKKEPGAARSTLSLGYGVCFGKNEMKAISMATLDRSMKSESASEPSANQEFVLMHTEGIESSGFCLHLKLPHYVTFQSKLDTLRKQQRREQPVATHG
ncbi:MAG: carbon-phosphorus lyase complex subunit PhnI [Spirochaetota bacterium]